MLSISDRIKSCDRPTDIYSHTAAAYNALVQLYHQCLDNLQYTPAMLNWVGWTLTFAHLVHCDYLRVGYILTYLLKYDESEDFTVIHVKVKVK